MGTASASGADRARVAAEHAIACPLLEGVDLNGARGVLVNITASRSLKMRETREIMETNYAADDATVIFGTAYDESMGENLRVTVVATGLGRAQARPQLVHRRGAAHRHRQPAHGHDAGRRSGRLPQSGHAVCHAQPAQPGVGPGARAGKLGHGSLRHPGIPAQAGGLNLEPGFRLLCTPSSPACLSPRAGRRRSGPFFVCMM
ncbi:hypothetical protein WJ978_11890 [Achromobacter xylosoxidans]